MTLFREGDSIDFEGRRVSLRKAWCAAGVAFLAAIGLQMLLYGGVLWGGGPIWKFIRAAEPLDEALYLILFLVFALGPGVLAATFAFWRLRRWYRASGMGVPGSVVAAIVILMLVDSYLGVVVCFNIWGT